jgi:hypothetical protein
LSLMPMGINIALTFNMALILRECQLIL